MKLTSKRAKEERVDRRESIKKWAEMTKHERERSPVQRWVRGRTLYFRMPETEAKCRIKGDNHGELIELLVRWGWIPCSYWQYKFPNLFKLKAL
jgi:hypothetical protein